MPRRQAGGSHPRPGAAETVEQTMADLAGALAPLPRPGSGPAPGQSWEDRVTALIRHHSSHEAEVVADYKRLGEEVKDPALRYLIDLLVQDEERHHAVLTELVASVAAADWQPAAEALPRLGWRPLPPELGPQTKELIAAENQDARRLRDLRKQLRDVRDTTIWALVVELMELDTQKHRRILAFIEHRAKEMGR